MPMLGEISFGCPPLWWADTHLPCATAAIRFAAGLLITRISS